MVRSDGRNSMTKTTTTLFFIGAITMTLPGGAHAQKPDSAAQHAQMMKA